MHRRLGRFASWRAQVWDTSRLGHDDVVEETAEGCDLAAREGTKAVERCDLKMLLEPTFTGAAVHPACGEHGHGCARMLEGSCDRRLGSERLAEDNLPRLKSG